MVWEQHRSNYGGEEKEKGGGKLPRKLWDILTVHREANKDGVGR